MCTMDSISILTEINGQWLRVFSSSLACALAKDALDCLEVIWLRLPTKNIIFFEHCIGIDTAFRMRVTEPIHSNENLFLDLRIPFSIHGSKSILCTTDFVQMCEFNSIDYNNIFFCMGAIITFISNRGFDVSTLQFEIVNNESIFIVIRDVHMLRRTKTKYRFYNKIRIPSFASGRDFAFGF